MNRGLSGQPRGDHEVLIIIDVQNDFCPEGALAVPEGDAVIPTINRLAGEFAHVVLTQDWHPRGHASFASAHPGRTPFETVEAVYGPQTLWSDHCVQGSLGAALHPALDVPHAEPILRKASARISIPTPLFAKTTARRRPDSAAYLRERGIEKLTLCGLATDYCVLYSALDACGAGFAVELAADACRGIDHDGSLGRAMQAMVKAGVSIRR